MRLIFPGSFLFNRLDRLLDGQMKFCITDPEMLRMLELRKEDRIYQLTHAKKRLCDWINNQFKKLIEPRDPSLSITVEDLKDLLDKKISTVENMKVEGSLCVKEIIIASVDTDALSLSFFQPPQLIFVKKRI